MRYSLLRELIDESDRPRVIRNLEALREQLSTDLPAKDAENHLLMATWNVRDLGKLNRRGYGDRLPESHFYIAEVFSRFDFVAVQEVNELPEWEAIMRILGPTWDFLATDVTDPKLGGNGERLTYLFDQRKVSFRHIAGEIVLPPDKLVSQNVDPAPSDVPAVAAEVAGEEISRQFARSPFVASFQSSWFRFDICTVHIYYGAESGEKLAKRVAEIREIADYFGARAAETLKRGRSLILLGDFNIVHAEHETMTALLDSGFKTPSALEDAASNIGRDKYYDQIAFKTRRGRTRVRRLARPGRQAAGGRVRDLQARLHAGSVSGIRARGEGQPQRRGQDRRRARGVLRGLAHLPVLRSPADVGPARGQRQRRLSQATPGHLGPDPVIGCLRRFFDRRYVTRGIPFARG